MTTGNLARMTMFSARFGELIRGSIMFGWALWFGAFQRFERTGPFSSFEELSGNEWVWSAPFMAVALFAVAAAARFGLRARIAGSALTAIAWSWVAGGFAAHDYRVTIVPLTAGLAVYSCVGLLRLLDVRRAGLRELA